MNLFRRQSFKQALSLQGTFLFGVDVSKTLLQDKQWVIFTLVAPYFHSRPGYDPDKVDIFSELEESEISALRNRSDTYFMLNYSHEGNTHVEHNFWELLLRSGLKHKIPAEKIFFVTSNIREEDAYYAWQKEHCPDYKINVVSFVYFAYVISQDLPVSFSINKSIASVKENQKLFLSLNRRHRPYRLYTIYKIFESSFYKNTLISYNKIDKDLRFEIEELDRRMDIDTYNRLVKSAPSVLDFDNFERNWAFGPREAVLPFQLFEHTLISLVGETLFETNGCGLLYSEKTFKPMIFNHPMLIFGQPGLNTSLNEIGFRTYKNYFDLSFDTVENHADRIDLAINQIELLNDKLSSMTVNQRIDWLLQDRETLEFNKEALRSQEFNRKKLTQLIAAVKN